MTEELSTRIRDALKSSPIPIDELAEKTGIAIGAMKLFTLRARELPVAELDRLAAFLGIAPADAADAAVAAKIDSTPPTPVSSPSPAEPRKSSVEPPSDDTPPPWARPFEPGEEITYVNGIKQWHPRRPPPSRGPFAPHFYKCENGMIVEPHGLNPAFFARPGNKIVAASWNARDFFAIRECDLPPGFPPEAAMLQESKS